VAEILARLRRRGADWLRARRYTNFGWVVWWELTRACNLDCRYCISHRPAAEVDQEGVARGLARIIEVRPKYVEILGGEPLLVPDLPRILERMRQEAGVGRIMMSTNLSVALERAEAVLGKTDHLFVSIDALGPLNARLRGMDGDRLLERLARLAARIRDESLPTLLHTATVVTQENDGAIEPLLRAIQAIDPAIEMVLIPVEPYDHPLSLSHDPQRQAEFVALVDRLSTELNVVMTDRFRDVLAAGGSAAPAEGDCSGTAGGESDPPAPRRWRLPQHQCPRQFFRMIINEQGEAITCKPTRYLEFYGQELRRAPGIGRKLRLLTSLAQDLILRPNSMACRLPCSAAEFLDALLLLTPGQPMPREIEMFAGQFEEEELQRALGFIRRFLNPDLDRRLEEALRKPVGESEG
jgi:MoaA/NifB/PqqE/SkfB family radical SAM enzyme